MLQSMDQVPEIKYLLAYLSKATGFTQPNVFKFSEDKQYVFEGIIQFRVYHRYGRKWRRRCKNGPT